MKLQNDSKKIEILEEITSLKKMISNKDIEIKDFTLIEKELKEVKDENSMLQEKIKVLLNENKELQIEIKNDNSRQSLAISGN